MDKSPDAFRTISEVAEHLETPAHVLRFWESRFPQIRPVKRAGGRRYYRPADVALLSGIKRLLHEEGLTIRGVQKILREQGVRHVSGLVEAASVEDDLDAEAALEAALNANFAAPEKAVLPPAEVESAQIVALESALRRQAPTAKSKQPSLFAEDFEAPVPKVTKIKPSSPEDTKKIDASKPSAPDDTRTPDAGQAADLADDSVWLVDEVPEAPMHEDVEPEAAVAALFAAHQKTVAEESPPNQSLAEQRQAELDSAPPTPPEAQSEISMEDGGLLAHLRALPPGALLAHREAVLPLIDRLQIMRNRLAAPILATS